MKDYDLNKIATKVRELYEKTGIWPECVKLPRESYHAIFGHNRTQGVHRVTVPSGMHDSYFSLFFSPHDGCEPVIQWSKGLYNPHVEKDKETPPNLRCVPIAEMCGNCISSTPRYMKGQIRCQKYGAIHQDNYCCDDWRRNV